MTGYYTLIVSLPHHARHFKVKQTPISRTQLEKRLKLLPKEQQIRLQLIVNLIWDSWFSFTLPLSEVMKDAKVLLALNDRFINNMINWFFDIRSLITAIRLRSIQHTSPSHPNEYWHTHLNSLLIRNWNKPDFNMGNTYPWLIEMNNKLLANQTDEMEEILLTLIWKHLEAVETRHYFDFAALILYLLRWKIVDYWSTFNGEKSLERLIHFSDEMIAKENHDEPQTKS